VEWEEVSEVAEADAVIGLIHVQQGGGGGQKMNALVALVQSKKSSPWAYL